MPASTFGGADSQSWSFQCTEAMPRNQNAKLVVEQICSIRFHWCTGATGPLVTWLQKKLSWTEICLWNIDQPMLSACNRARGTLKPVHWDTLLKESPKGCAKPRSAYPELQEVSPWAGRVSETKILTDEEAFRRAWEPRNYVLTSPAWGCPSCRCSQTH